MDGMPDKTSLLYGAVAIILVLVSTVSWLVIARTRLRRRYEGLLEKAVLSGAKTIKEVNSSIEIQQGWVVDAIGKMVERTDFDTYNLEHSQEHARIEGRISSIRDLYGELKEAIVELTSKVDSGMASMSGLLSKLVTIRNHDEDTTNRRVK